MALLTGLFHIAMFFLRLPFIIMRGCFCSERDHHGGGDILFISHLPWDKVWLRNQHVAKHLSSTRKILYVSTFPFHFLVQFDRHPFSLRGSWVTDNIFAISLPVLVGESRLPIVRHINRLYMKSFLLSKSRRIGITPGILWFSHPFAESLTRYWKGAPVAYDVQDEYAAVPTAQKGTRQREISLLQRAGVVFTGTYSLYLKKKEHAGNIHFIPCGVDFDHFNRACDDSLETPADVADIGGERILGYFGDVGERFDWPLIEGIATRHPEWAIVLIGTVTKRNRDMDRLENVHILGKRSYDELPDYVRGWDVCLIPFKIDDLTRHIYPTKLLEYFSAGKPVISSAIPDVERFFSNIVGIAGDVESFEKEMATVDDSDARITKGLAIAKHTSWENVVGKMERYLNKVVSDCDERNRKSDSC